MVTVAPRDTGKRTCVALARSKKASAADGVDAPFVQTSAAWKSMWFVYLGDKKLVKEILHCGSGGSRGVHITRAITYARARRIRKPMRRSRQSQGLAYTAERS